MNELEDDFQIEELAENLSKRIDEVKKPENYRIDLIITVRKETSHENLRTCIGVNEEITEKMKKDALNKLLNKIKYWNEICKTQGKEKFTKIKSIKVNRIQTIEAEYELNHKIPTKGEN